MIEVFPFRAEHLDMIELASGQSEPDAAMGKSLESMDSFTGVKDGVVLFCVGRVKQWQGRWIV